MSNWRRYRFIEIMLDKMPFRESVARIYEAVQQYGQKLRLTLIAIVVSILAQIIIFFGIWSLSTILKINLSSVIDYFIAFPVCMVINSIPLAPGGLGVGEAGFHGVFLLFGSDKGAELAILYHMIFFAQRIGLGGVVYLFSDFSKDKLANSRSFQIE
jgi:uncharacterized membrane protein YbhN (UPF0104 family)